VKRLFAILFPLLIIIVFLYIMKKYIPFGVNSMVVAKHYLTDGLPETGSTNIVTSIVVLYRGFDTLGEVTVLFLAALGFGAILEGMRKKTKEVTSSLVVRTSTRYLFPLIVLFGVYIFTHGHLTPGGGFPGGVIIAAGILLMYLAYKDFQINHTRFKITESLAGIIFVGMGLAGLAIYGSFLANFLPEGLPRHIFSAGIIPIIYIAIGFKVGSELGGLVGEGLEDKN